MMGRLNQDQGQLFYSFCLEEAVPEDHLVRDIAAVLDLTWVRAELAPYYSSTGRPSIDPELMVRMLIIGYVFAIRSERALCRDVQVNFAYRWFCGLSIEDKIPDRQLPRPAIDRIDLPPSGNQCQRYDTRHNRFGSDPRGSWPGDQRRHWVIRR